MLCFRKILVSDKHILLSTRVLFVIENSKSRVVEIRELFVLYFENENNYNEVKLICLLVRIMNTFR